MIVMDKKPTDKFWALVDESDEVLGKSLAKRPITTLEITAACTAFHKAFQKLCLRVKQ